MNANEWRAKARARIEQMAVDLILPSGATIKFCRPNLSAWLSGGRMPESFVLMLSKLEKSEMTGAVAMSQLTPEDLVKYQTFLNDLVVASVVFPRVVLGETDADDEISLSDVPIEDQEFILKLALQLAPNVPVATKGGDVPLKAIEEFRHESEGSVSAQSGGNVQQVRHGKSGKSLRHRRRNRKSRV